MDCTEKPRGCAKKSWRGSKGVRGKCELVSGNATGAT